MDDSVAKGYMQLGETIDALSYVIGNGKLAKQTELLLLSAVHYLHNYVALLQENGDA